MPVITFRNPDPDNKADNKGEKRVYTVSEKVTPSLLDRINCAISGVAELLLHDRCELWVKCRGGEPLDAVERRVVGAICDHFGWNPRTVHLCQTE